MIWTILQKHGHSFQKINLCIISRKYQILETYLLQQCFARKKRNEKINIKAFLIAIIIMEIWASIEIDQI